MARPPHQLIPFVTYQRIFQVLYSALETAEARTHRACIFFSIVGTAILQDKHGLDAQVVAGAAAYAFDQAGLALITFGKDEGGHLACGPDAFHAWIQCDGYAIDFMAPIFGESVRASGHDVAVPRKMFQKPLAADAGRIPDPGASGAFLLVPDQERTDDVKAAFGASAMNSDLGAIAMSWYRPAPKPMKQELSFHDTQFGTRYLRLRAPALDGVW